LNNEQSFTENSHGLALPKIPMDATINGIALRNAVAGGQVEFQITDRVRGESGWILLNEQFVNVPQEISVLCPADPTSGCSITGQNLDYIKSYSVGGEKWTEPGAVGMAGLGIGPVGTDNKVWVQLWGFPGKLQLRNILRAAPTP